MSINLDAIEAAARAAAKGSGGVWWDVEGLRHKPTLTKPDRTHIATMDPQTTLALVERVRELEELEERALALQADWENGSDEDIKMGVGRVVDWLRAREASGWKWVDWLSWRRKA